jgi:hypothetical protein
MYVREIGWEVADWFYVTQDREQWLALMNTLTKGREFD